MRAPEFPKGLDWINTDRPLSIGDLKGHVVLLDFWTYCCINCLHVLHDLAYLEEKYQNEPFVVIGVHSAKFFNEQETENIEHAVNRYEIQHPVVNDANHEIWDRYGVRAWPTFVLIGADGEIIGVASGEGNREVLDRAIGQALEDARAKGILAEKKIALQAPERPKSFLNYPGKMAYNPETGLLYVSDSNNNRILELALQAPDEAKLVRVIGSGKIGSRDGSLTEASFYRPQGLAVHQETLFVCDTENHMIRAVDLKAGNVSTLAGNGKQAQWGARGGFGPDVSLNSPWDCVYVKGALYIAMAGPHQLWKLDLSTGMVDVFAGNGWENLVDGPARSAQLAQPSGITSDGELLYFADSEVSALRTCRIDTGEVRTLIGKGLFDFGHADGTFGEALLQHPLGVHYHGGYVYIADTYNHAVRVAQLGSGEVRTLIGRTEEKACWVNGTIREVQPLNEPNDVLMVDGRLYITDTNHHLLRVYDFQENALKTVRIVQD